MRQKLTGWEDLNMWNVSNPTVMKTLSVSLQVITPPLHSLIRVVLYPIHMIQHAQTQTMCPSRCWDRSISSVLIRNRLPLKHQRKLQVRNISVGVPVSQSCVTGCSATRCLCFMFSLQFGCKDKEEGAVRESCVWGPALLSADWGPLLKHFLRSLTKKNQGGGLGSRLRIILLVLHGLAAAQPLTPVRDDLTHGSVQVGRGGALYHHM